MSRGRESLCFDIYFDGFAAFSVTMITDWFSAIIPYNRHILASVFAEEQYYKRNSDTCVQNEEKDVCKKDVKIVRMELSILQHNKISVYCIDKFP